MDSAAGILATVVATIVASGIASLVAWVTCRRTLHAQERAEVRSRIDQLAAVAIEYPLLEDDAFCCAWPEKGPYSTDQMRYDNYCCLVFNALETAFDHFEGDAAALRRFVGVRELVWRHRRWWRAESVRALNLAGYSDAKFTRFVDDELASAERLEKEGKR